MTEEERFLAWYGEFLAELEVDELVARRAYDSARAPMEIVTDIGGRPFKWYLTKRPFVPVSR